MFGLFLGSELGWPTNVEGRALEIFGVSHSGIIITAADTSKLTMAPEGGFKQGRRTPRSGRMKHRREGEGGKGDVKQGSMLVGDGSRIPARLNRTRRNTAGGKAETEARAN